MENPDLGDGSFIGRVTIVIEISDCDGNRVIEKCSSVFHKRIDEIISKKIQELIFSLNENLSIDRLVVDIGMIEYELFEVQMVDKLTLALEKALSVYYQAIPKFSLGETGAYPTCQSERQLIENGLLAQSLPQMSAALVENRISVPSVPSVQSVADIAAETTATGELSLIATVEHYLQQGDWSTPSNQILPLNSQESPLITQDLWLQVQRQPQQWLPMLAKHCLQPSGRRRLSVILSQAAQKVLCRLMTEDNPIAVQFNHTSRVTPEQLTTAAEHYFRNQGAVTKENPDVISTPLEWPPQTTPPIAMTEQLNHTARRGIPEQLTTAAEQYFRNQGAVTKENPDVISTPLEWPPQTTPPIAMTEQLNHTARRGMPEQLTTTAEHYFRNQGAVAKENPEATPTQPKWLPQKASSVASDLTRRVDKETPEPIFATTLKGNKPPAWSGTKPVAQPMGVDIAPISGKVLAVSNAGSLIFWPLLSTFFSIFGLLEKQVFINQQAQVDAVCLLDWLIWGDDEISNRRLTLTKVLCGLPMHFDAAWCAPAAEQKIVISEWLEGVRGQLPAWKRMGSEDIRTLFLQRAGEILWLEGGITIHVNSEIYDALINDWPWPMNMACFNWLQQPLTIRWL
ncbi:contractile injection system tape measure protein [Yersinia sp. 1252 StPb PI]|uniref:contractile injection system tape measure protein n=1 Tax=Yersinia sp. 1252 StPb PI TaxID=3117404 RepID=UPI003B286744